LFPHLDVAHNIGLLPKVLGWERSRIARRVDEMLSLVGLEPGSFRGRFPKELSGGQQQRVGVARALAADPPVLLMDEPFGAIDPVTRARLQDELLGLQAQLRKTIVFVTHDIDEAVKMGDRVAIFEAGGRLAQYDLPDRVLAAPADAFVSGFVGRGTSLMRLRLRRVDELPVASWTVGGEAAAPADVLAALRVADRPAALVIDGEGRPRSWILTAQLENAVARVGGLDVIDGTPVRAVGPRASLADALDALLISPARVAVVVDGNGVYRGVLDIGTLAASVPPESEPCR
jgi:osmoprotectant transport system ATP-binding protein